MTRIPTRVGLAVLLTLAVTAPVAGESTNVESDNSDPVLAGFFPVLIGDQPVDSWTLGGDAYLDLFDASVEPDRTIREDIEAALDERGRKDVQLGVGSATYLPPSGGFATLTAVRLGGVTETALREFAGIIWDREVASEPNELLMEDGSVVPVFDLGPSSRQIPFNEAAYMEADIAWLIEAPEDGLPLVIRAIQDASIDACPEPTIEHQFDGSATEGSDTGRALAVVEVDFATCGAIRPTTEEIGVRMDTTRPFTNPADWKKAIDSYGPDAAILGLAPPRFETTSNGALPNLWSNLSSGTPAGIAVNYGEVSDRSPGCSASAGFRDGHALWLRAARIVDGDRQVLVYDSLADGQNAGPSGKKPDGPQWWPWRTIRAAASRMQGGQGWIGGVSDTTRELRESDWPVCS